MARTSEKLPLSLRFAGPALAALALLSGFVFDFTKIPAVGAGYTVTALMVMLAAAAVFLMLTRRMTPDRALMLLLAAGFLMRLLFVASWSVTNMQHDVYTFYDSYGHAGYILHFYNNGLTMFEDSPLERWSFYNPPLWHALAGSWLRLNTALGLSFERACENIQCLTLAFSSLCMTVSLGIFRRFGLKGYARVFAAGIICLHPTFFLLSGSVNNDILCVLLTLAAFGAALAWYQEPTLPRILASAVLVGLAMLTKTSGVIAAPAMALLFVARFIKDRRSQPKRLIGQFAAFGAVSLPLGLWWSVRSLALYGIPLGYVPRLPDDSYQYIGNVSAAKRLFAPQLTSCFISHPELNGSEALEYNIPSALLKTSMFGEYTLAELGSKTYYIDCALLAVNVLLAAAALAAMIGITVRAFRRKTDERALIASLALFWLTNIVMYIKFCFDFPHICTMDFRYLVPTCVLGALSLGLWLQQGGKAKTLKIARGGLWALGFAFGSLSAAAYALYCVFDARLAPRFLCAAAAAVMLAAVSLTARRGDEKKRRMR